MTELVKYGGGSYEEPEDVSAPVLSHVPISSSEYRKGFNITAQVTDDVEVQHVEFCFRQEEAIALGYAAYNSGGESYYAVPLDKGEDDIYSITLVSHFWTKVNFSIARPFEYFIRAYDKDNIVSTATYKISFLPKANLSPVSFLEVIREDQDFNFEFDVYDADGSLSPAIAACGLGYNDPEDMRHFRYSRRGVILSKSDKRKISKPGEAFFLVID